MDSTSSTKTQVSRWILEFLVRNPQTEGLAKRAMPVLHPPPHPRLTKAFLLRTVDCELSDASLSEDTLQALELIDDLQARLCHPPADAIRAAYCAVALECTVRLLVGGGGKTGAKYMTALNRIWGARVSRLEKGRLSTSELSRWKGVVVAAVKDAGVREKLVALNTRNDAIASVRDYLKEAWALEGKSFIATAIRLRDEGEENRIGETFTLSDLIELAMKAGLQNLGDHDTVEDDCGSDKAVALPGSPADLLHNDAFMSNGKEELGTDVVVQNKCVSPCRQRRDTEESDRETSGQICTSFPSTELENAQEALRASSLELKRVVVDPLPEALQVSDTVIANLTTENVIHQQALENLTVKEANTSAAASTEPLNSRDADVGDPSCSKQDKVPAPSLMERNSTARTEEWSDPIDSSPEARTKLNLPSSRKRVVSPLKAYEPAKIYKRRQPRRWSLLEEDTLRTAVQKFGKGNWKLILNSNLDIFEGRTEVDLKDKWRNMTK